MLKGRIHQEDIKTVNINIHPTEDHTNIEGKSWRTSKKMAIKRDPEGHLRE